jgi:two-component sensor histidine kinase
MCKVFFIKHLSPFLLRLLSAIFLSFYCFSTIKAQPFDYLPDSTKTALKTLPESLHDSIYEVKGSEYYAQFNAENYGRALDCYNKGLALAEKYQHKMWILELTHDIGAVYDAQGDNPDKVLDYYKRANDMAANLNLGDDYKLPLAYSLAHAYNLLHDSTNSMRLLNYLKKSDAIYQNQPKLHQKYILLMAYLSMKNNNISDFKRHFEAIDTSIKFQNGRFPYGRYYAVCVWRYAFEKGNYEKAIETIQLELKNNATDSSLLMNYLASAYARSDNYQKAYEWADKLNQFDAKHLKESVRKDLTVNLLQTEIGFKEREAALKSKENKILLIGFLTTLLLSSIALYFWRANYKSKKELVQRNAEKDVLINEIHHRVKNNLQLLYGLAKLQLPTIKDEKAKALWQKHLTQLQAMSLVNEKLYAHEGLAALSIKTFIMDILQHFEKIFPLKGPLSINAKIDENLIVNADFAVSFGLIFSELITNSYKYVFQNTENPRLDLSISTDKNNKLKVNYTDFGQLKDPSVYASKQTGGAALIRDLTRQLKGDVTIDYEPYLAYEFNFELIEK